MKKLCAVGLGLCFSPGLAAPANQDGPDIRCEFPFYYVGLTQNQAKAEIDHRFQIVNRGSAPAEIVSAEGACGCTKKSKQAYRFEFEPLIQPGRSEDLRIQFASAPIAGVPDIREFSVRFRDGAVPTLNLTVLSKRLQPVTLFPGEDVIVLCRSAEPFSRNVYVVAQAGKDLQLVLEEPVGPGLKIEAVRIAQSTELDLPASVWEEGSVFALRLRSNGLCRESAGNYTARLTTNHPEVPQIQLRLTVLQAH